MPIEVRLAYIWWNRGSHVILWVCDWQMRDTFSCISLEFAAVSVFNPCGARTRGKGVDDKAKRVYYLQCGLVVHWYTTGPSTIYRKNILTPLTWNEITKYIMKYNFILHWSLYPIVLKPPVVPRLILNRRFESLLSSCVGFSLAYGDSMTWSAHQAIGNIITAINQ